jgi:hypothetical protein
MFAQLLVVIALFVALFATISEAFFWGGYGFGYGGWGYPSYGLGYGYPFYGGWGGFYGR